MDIQLDVNEKLNDALIKLYYNDYLLMKNKCCERSIVFRLGLYLANSLAEYEFDVDCEYNKNGEKPKSLGNKRFNYPDVIVHKRGKKEDNLLVIEAKTPNDTQTEHFEKDADKLKGFTGESPYLYTGGAHLYIAATTCSLVWYTEGKVQKHLKYKVDKNTHSLLQVEPNDLQNQTAFDRWYFNKRLVNIFV